MSTDAISIESQSQWLSLDWSEWEGWCKETALRTASYLTDPLCKSRELLMRCYVIHDIHPDAYRVTNLVRQILLLQGMAVCALLAVSWTLPAMALRYAVCCLQKELYVYRKGNIEEKDLQGSTFTLLSWNICYTQAGYELTDGGVLSSPERIQTLSDKIVERDADVICLYEVFESSI
jgi:hypothetical protein